MTRRDTQNGAYLQRLLSPLPTRTPRQYDFPLQKHKCADGGRICPHCHEWRQLAGFAHDLSKASGRKSWCKSCDASKSRAYYQANRARVITRVTASNERRRLVAAADPLVAVLAAELAELRRRMRVLERREAKR
jgi:hypothetical protein